MTDILGEVNEKFKIVSVKGKSLDFNEMTRVLGSKQDKYTLLYGKHFYGFEKEGRSSYFSEKQMGKGHYFTIDCPLKVDLIRNDKGGIL